MGTVYLRKANNNDLDLLYKWANDSVVRSNSFNSEPISYDSHVKWFGKMMKDSSVIQYILMDEDIAVGQIRLAIDGEEAEIGYSIASEFRGMGYGHKILQLAVDEVKNNNLGIHKLVAKVKPENAASNKLFGVEEFERMYVYYAKVI